MEECIPWLNIFSATFLQIGSTKDKPPLPFMFNPYWFNDLELIELVQNGWKHYHEGHEDTIMFKFNDNLKRVKKRTIKWAKVK